MLSHLGRVARQVGYHVSIASRKVPLSSTEFPSKTTIVTRHRTLYLGGVVQCYVDIVRLSYCCGYTRCYLSSITVHDRLAPRAKPEAKEGTRVDFEMAALAQNQGFL